MGLEDIVLFPIIPGPTVSNPSDAVSTKAAVEVVANTKDVCFIHTSRVNTAGIYGND